MISVNTWVTASELGYILEHSDADTLIFVGCFSSTTTCRCSATLSRKRRRAEAQAAYSCRRARLQGSVPFTTSIAAAGGGQGADRAAGGGPPGCHLPALHLGFDLDAKGRPVAALRSDRELVEYRRAHARHAGDRLWLAVSLFWGLGCENALFNMFTHGGCLVLQEHFDAGEALRLIEEERCSSTTARPTWRRRWRSTRIGRSVT